MNKCEFEFEKARKMAESHQEILGQGMAVIRAEISKISAIDESVLIYGEPGTGKELAVTTLHDQSERNGMPIITFVAVGRSFSGMEAQLFGTLGDEKGTTTGLLEHLEGGTLHIREVSKVPTSLVSRLLESSRKGYFIDPLGEQRPFDVSLIFTSRHAPAALTTMGIPGGALRNPINMPSLREHPEDIPELLNHFVRSVCESNNLAAPRVSEAVISVLKAHRFPGNVRELIQLVEILVFNSAAGEISLADLSPKMTLSAKLNGSAAVRRPFKIAVQETERSIIQAALAEVGGNYLKASVMLGIHRNSLAVKMRELKIWKNKRPGRRGQARRAKEGDKSGLGRS